MKNHPMAYSRYANDNHEKKERAVSDDFGSTPLQLETRFGRFGDKITWN